MKIERAFNAEDVNRIINDPSIYPWIKGTNSGELDMAKVIADQRNFALVSEYGCSLGIRLQAGIYEFHTSVLPEGRGVWMKDFAAEAFHWMFTKTDAYELMTKCPDDNVAAKAAAKSVGCSFQFRTGPIWATDRGLIPVDVYSILIQNWAARAPKLEDIGHWFHETLISEYKRLGKKIDVIADDATHDRYVGVAIDMIKGGQLLKALNFYHRWALLAGYAPISVVNREPLVLDISEAQVHISNNSFTVL